MKNQKVFAVWNNTDNIPVNHEAITLEEAKRTVKEFPERFKNQGYYLTIDRERIKPEEVELIIYNVKTEERIEPEEQAKENNLNTI